jgi:hypothetical protein
LDAKRDRAFSGVNPQTLWAALAALTALAALGVPSLRCAPSPISETLLARSGTMSVSVLNTTHRR